MCVRSIVALLVFAILTVMGILNGGQLSAFIDTPSFLLTVGGGLLLALISYPFGTSRCDREGFCAGRDGSIDCRQRGASVAWFGQLVRQCRCDRNDDWTD